MSAATLSGRVPVARRQLSARRGRTVAGVVGIAVALLLVLALRAIFAGLESRMTAYIDRSGADVIVAQEGVTTMHMTQSALPAATVRAVARIPGVAAADGILYKSATIEANDASGIAALVGGGPVPGLVSGRPPGSSEIVLDRALAEQLSVEQGDHASTLGRSLRIAGEVEGTAAINGSFAFLDRATLARMLQTEGVVSYVLVRARDGVPPDVLAQRIEASVPRVSATTRKAFAASERRVVGDMTTDIVRGMTLIGFVIGVAIAGLVAYSTTLAQLRDYGILRAIGLRGRSALAMVLTQIGVTVTAAFVLALALLGVLAAGLPALSPTLALTLRARDVGEAALVAAGVTLGAALVPLVRVVRIEPAAVFRRAA